MVNMNQPTLLELKITGLTNMVNRMDFQQPLEATLGRFIQHAGETVAGSARSKAPVDVGTLRASINAQFKAENGVFTSVVGSNVFYAPFMEYGTGTQHDHPNWPRKPHRIPPGVLDAWAERKLRGGAEGTPEELGNMVRMRIMRKGGLKPRRFLRSSFEELQMTISSGVRKIISETLRLS